MEIIYNLLHNKSKSIDGCSKPLTQELQQLQQLQHVHNLQQTLQSLKEEDTNQNSDPEMEDSSDPEYQYVAAKEEEINHLFNLYSISMPSTNDSTDHDHTQISE